MAQETPAPAASTVPNAIGDGLYFVGRVKKCEFKENPDPNKAPAYNIYCDALGMDGVLKIKCATFAEYSKYKPGDPFKSKLDFNLYKEFLTFKVIQ